MEFLWTAVLAFAALFGLGELMTWFSVVGDGEAALDTVAAVVGSEFPEVAALVASTTDAVSIIASTTESVLPLAIPTEGAE